MSDRMNLFEMATAQFNQAADAIKLNTLVRTVLSQPQNEITVNFPVLLDDGTYRLFKGYRIQHNNTNGPYKGGIRFHGLMPPISKCDAAGASCRLRQ
jgi:glutamate dehydrogenase (NAD(P)+)